MKNKKKKSVFLAGLMVLIMMVSLLSGMNLGVAKAAEITANENAENRDITVYIGWQKTNDEQKVSIPVVLTGKVDNYEKEYKYTITKDDKYEHIFKNLPKKNSDGKEIKYEVTVDGEDDGKVTLSEKEFFVSHKDNLKDNEWIIINEYNDRTDIQITIRKVWEGTAPTDKNFKLLFEILPENGRAIPVTMTPMDGGKIEIRVKKNDDDGKPIKYTVREVSESKAFNKKDTSTEKMTVQGEDKTITFTNERVEKLLHIEKKWIGNEGEAVEFVINGNENDVITLRKSNDGWKTTKSLPVYNLEGKPIDYEITERATRGYTTEEATKKFQLVDGNGKPADATVSFKNTEIPSSDSSTVVNDVISVPSTPTVPEAIPVIPVSDATPTVTTPETTPTVTVPDDATPQGDANVSNGNTKAETTDEDTDNNEDVDDNDNNDKDVVDVDEDDIPQGEAKVKKDTSKEAPVKVEEDVTPKGSANLPKTGGTMGGFLSLIGMGLIGLALAIRKRK